MGNSTSALTHFISKWREHEIVLWLYMTVISTFGVGVGDSDVGESRVQGLHDETLFNPLQKKRSPGRVISSGCNITSANMLFVSENQMVL